MTKKPEDKKVGTVGKAPRAKGVSETQAVGEVDGVEKTSSVGGVKGVSGVGKTGSVSALSFANRDKLMNLVAEEAERLSKTGAIPKSQKAIVERAVKMVIDAALIDDGSKKDGK